MLLVSGAHMLFREEAEKCRRQAEAFSGKPEAPFLLGIAHAFEDLAAEKTLASEAVTGSFARKLPAERRQLA
jgi:hypothetical protein